ncbi:hypothetical protein BDW22DRAFT_1433089 [Trametopsis cervina]|nr:hypothetical protein BDW22DRAFT_1433089 [Trametopsis cervina]
MKADVYSYVADQEHPRLKAFEDLTSALKFMIKQPETIPLNMRRDLDLPQFMTHLKVFTEQDTCNLVVTEASSSPLKIRTGRLTPFTICSPASSPTKKVLHTPSSPVEVSDLEEEIKSKKIVKRKRKVRRNSALNGVAVTTAAEANTSLATVEGPRVIAASDVAAQPLNSSVGRVYINMRNDQGRIIFANPSLPPPPYGLVPALGAELNDYFDCWGASNAYIENLWTARVHASSEDEFVSLVPRSVSELKASWLWRAMCIPMSASRRARNFARR